MSGTNYHCHQRYHHHYNHSISVAIRLFSRCCLPEIAQR